MALSITVSVTGTPTEEEARGGRLAASLENEWRAKQDPPQQQLPTGNATEIRAAAQVYFVRLLIGLIVELADRKSQDDYEEARARWALATDAQRTAALANLPPLPG